MCMACQEMDLYYAYLDAIEEEKRKAQPWQCEVTVIAPSEGAPAPTPAGTAAKSVAGAKSVASAKSVVGAKSGFACDNPE